MSASPVRIRWDLNSPFPKLMRAEIKAMGPAWKSQIAEHLGVANTPIENHAIASVAAIVDGWRRQKKLSASSPRDHERRADYARLLGGLERVREGLRNLHDNAADERQDPFHHSGVDPYTAFEVIKHYLSMNAERGSARRQSENTCDAYLVQQLALIWESTTGHLPKSTDKGRSKFWAFVLDAAAADSGLGVSYSAGDRALASLTRLRDLE